MGTKSKKSGHLEGDNKTKFFFSFFINVQMVTDIASGICKLRVDYSIYSPLEENNAREQGITLACSHKQRKKRAICRKFSSQSEYQRLQSNLYIGRELLILAGKK